MSFCLAKMKVRNVTRDDSLGSVGDQNPKVAAAGIPGLRKPRRPGRPQLDDVDKKGGPARPAISMLSAVCGRGGPPPHFLLLNSGGDFPSVFRVDPLFLSRNFFFLRGL